MQQFAQSTEQKRILFCGDDNLDRAAIYLAAILYQQRYSFDYIPSTENFPDNLPFDEYHLIIFSDYPRHNLPNQHLEFIEQFVRNGSNFLMIGGWESFTGLQKEYTDTILQDVLPVTMQPDDDRVNLSQGCIVLPAQKHHPITDNIDWSQPGIIGGYNHVVSKSKSTTILKGNHLSIDLKKESAVIVNSAEIPLLIEGLYHKGKVGALAFDLAPHWIGGLVDWGKQRIRIDFNGTFIEVGSLYQQFVSNLIAHFYK